MKLSTLISKRIAKLGATQAEYAAVLGISQQALSQILQGGGVSAETLRALARAGGIPRRQLDAAELPRKNKAA